MLEPPRRWRFSTRGVFLALWKGWGHRRGD